MEETHAATGGGPRGAPSPKKAWGKNNKALEEVGLSAVAIGVAVFCAALLAWLGAVVLARPGNGRGRALDVADGDLRKVHATATPRVGGIAVAAGIAGGVAAVWAFGEDVGSGLVLLACVAPGLVWGLIEDLSKRGAVAVRLALSGVGAGLAFVLLDARITLVDLPVIDELLAIHAVSFAFTVFAVAGVTNAINVIDGLNGLAGVTSLFAAIGLAMVAWVVGDQFVFASACVLAASVAGFLRVNFPSGRIFLGDGGAYLIGLTLALLSVMLVQRNSQVSPWFPLVLLAYPIWETIFSMYRRKNRGRSTGEADALHLHTLVYRRVVRWKGPRAKARDCAVRNSLASMYLWALPAICWAFAVAFWNRSLVLQAGAVVFALVYIAAYRRIVRFRVPRSLLVRAKADAPGVDAEEAVRHR